MANQLSFRPFAEAAAIAQGSVTLLTVVEKELLHYEILRAMAETGLLQQLVFQGGTALRLCYAGSRYSEDLDFAGGVGFDFAALGALPGAIERAICGRYAVTVDVRPPQRASQDENGVNVDTWQIQVITEPGHSDVPQQRIKVGVANVPAHTRAVRPMAVNYTGLPSTYQQTIIGVETPEEILADKLVSFACATQLRYRDLWDIPWLATMPGFNMNAAIKLVPCKVADYFVADFPSKVSARASVLPDIVNSDQFRKQMERFIHPDQLAATIRNQMWLDYTAQMIQNLYQQAIACSNPNQSPSNQLWERVSSVEQTHPKHQDASTLPSVPVAHQSI